MTLTSTQSSILTTTPLNYFAPTDFTHHQQESQLDAILIASKIASEVITTHVEDLASTLDSGPTPTSNFACVSLD